MRAIYEARMPPSVAPFQPNGWHRQNRVARVLLLHCFIRHSQPVHLLLPQKHACALKPKAAATSPVERGADGTRRVYSSVGEAPGGGIAAGAAWYCHVSSSPGSMSRRARKRTRGTEGSECDMGQREQRWKPNP